MVFDLFNAIYKSRSSDKIKKVIYNTMLTVKSSKPRGRPKSTERTLPLISSIKESIPIPDIVDESKKRSARLASIRKLMGISISEFSERLGIPEFRLVSYLYARVKKIPSSILTLAEEMLESEQTKVRSKAAIDNLAMPEILDAWRKKVGGTNLRIEQILGISSSTMARWELCTTRPSVTRLRDYNRLIDRAVMVKERRKKRIA